MRPPAILVVEDDDAIAEGLVRVLDSQGYAVRRLARGRPALTEATDEVGLVVLDLGLPDMDGIDVCRRLRAARPDLAILILSARDQELDVVSGLDAGADDYLVKPFDLGELRARLRALLRRAGAGDGDPDAITFAELRLDSSRHGAGVGDDFVELTRTEFQLLELLMLNPRRVLPHSLIYDRVWGYDFGPTSNALRVYVGYLRRKLEEAGARPLIHTVRGVGYVLREP